MSKDNIRDEHARRKRRLSGKGTTHRFRQPITVTIRRSVETLTPRTPGIRRLSKHVHFSRGDVDGFRRGAEEYKQRTTTTAVSSFARKEFSMGLA